MVLGKVKINDIYDTNDTMRMIKSQLEVVSIEILERLEDIAEARPRAFKMKAAIDIFLLGYYYGKRNT